MTVPAPADARSALHSLLAPPILEVTEDPPPRLLWLLPWLIMAATVARQSG
jgi:hypothetical protein